MISWVLYIRTTSITANWIFFIIFQVDLNHVYGETLDRQHKLRLFKDGKLKYQVCPIWTLRISYDLPFAYIFKSLVEMYFLTFKVMFIYYHCFLGNWWRGISSHSQRYPSWDDLPASCPWTPAVCRGPGGVWFGAWSDDVCHDLAART